MTIGELARRLRVSPRALRHYEALGLLRPSHVDRHTGYRYYGPAELARGLRVEQLKAAGLPLASIVRILDDDVPIAEALAAHRSQLVRAITEQQRHLAVVEAMLDTSGDALGAGARRGRVGPRPRHRGSVRAGRARPAPSAGCSSGSGVMPFAASTCGRSTYSAVFPLDPAPEIATRVAAHIERPCDGSVVLDGVTAMAVDIVGAHALLPVAQDAAVAEARSRGLEPCGWVWEQYLEIGPLPRTRLLVPVAAGH